MSTETPPSSTLSPDGRFRWTGAEWVPVAQASAAVLPAPVPAGSSRGLSVASLVLGVVGGLGLGSVAAVVLGHVARHRGRRAGRRPNGVALAGLVIGYVGIALLPLLAAVAIPVFLNQREKAVDADLDAALVAVAQEHEVRFVEAQTYAAATSPHLTTSGDRGPVFVDVLAADANGYCLRATSGDDVRYYDSAAAAASGTPCG